MEGHDGKTFISSKAALVEQAYKHEIELQTRAQTETGKPIDEVEAYCKTSGGMKKSQVYGSGSSKHFYFGGGSSSGTNGRGVPSMLLEIDQLKENSHLEKKKARLRQDEEINHLDQRQTLLEQQVVVLLRSVPTLSNPEDLNQITGAG